MRKQEDILAAKLTALADKRNLRRLPLANEEIDFWSNDYLGIARDFPEVKTYSGGATGSRLISGNRAEYHALEKEIAHFHRAPAALIFNGGYAANLGLLSAVPQRGDTVLYDQLIHASLRDGLRLGNAAAFSFRHNDLNHLEDRLKKAKGSSYVVTESVFSMDGDFAPLLEIVDLCEHYGAALVVDEAHAAGIYGPRGAGLVSDYQLEERVFARVVTYGKAFGCHGAAVLGSQTLIDYLINHARPFIFSTAMSPHAWAAIAAAYRMLNEEHGNRSKRLFENITRYQNNLRAIKMDQAKHLSPIQLFFRPGNENALRMEAQLRKNGLLAKAIRHPTVAVGTERIRICLHAFNTAAEIDQLTQTLRLEH